MIQFMSKDFLAVVILIGLIYVVVFSNWFKILKLALKLPGPPAFPVIGNALLATDNKALLYLGQNIYQHYGRLVRIWLSFMPVFLVLEPRDLQKIMGTSQNTDKPFLYSLMHNFLGDGLITNSGEKWKFHRKILQPVFHKNILESFVRIFCDKSKLLIEELDRVTAATRDVKVTLLVNKTVINILNEAVLGITENSQHDLSPFRKGKVLTQERITHPWLLLDFIFNFTKNAKDEMNHMENLYSFTNKILQQRREERKDITKSKRNNLLEKLIDIGENNPEFTDDDIINEICTFMLAGQDSVSAGLAFCLYFLAQHQQVQNRVFEEINHILTERDNISVSQLKKMTYLEQCIKETLRLCPSVPMIARKLTESVTIDIGVWFDWPGNDTLPAGCDVLIASFATHRLPHVYPDPQKFKPERFSPEKTARRHPFAYLPFSAGPRNCIGYKFALLEMKMVLSTILRRYHLSVTPGYELGLAFRVTLRAQGGIWLRFKPRR